jgi:hypothetical protein
MVHRLVPALTVFTAAFLISAGALPAKDFPGWNGYPPMFSVNGVIGYQGNIYGTSSGGIFKYDPETDEYTLFYKNHGLPSNDVLCAASTSDYIFFGFAAAGLIQFDPKTGRFDPVLFPEYAPNKMAVRSIFALNDSVLFVGHSLGIDILNLRSKEVRTVTRLGDFAENTQVNEVKVFNGKIWVCTQYGLAVADENNPNLDVETSWRNYTYSSFSKQAGFNCIIHVHDDAEDTVYIGTQGQGVVSFDDSTGTFAISAVQSGTFYKMYPGVGRYWAATDKGLFIKLARLWYLQSGKYLNLTDVWSDGEREWVGSLNDGLQCWSDSGWVNIAPVPGPRRSKFVKIDIAEDNVVWATTSINRGRRAPEDGALLERLQKGEWTDYSRSDGFATSPVSAAVDKKNNVWLALWGRNGSGMFVIQDDGIPDKKDDFIIPVDYEKKIFRATIDTSYVVCTDVTTDKHGNIWVANHQLNEPDSEEGGNSHNIEPIPSSGAVVVDGYPITKSRHFSPLSGDIPTAKIYDIRADDDNWVWMSTERVGLMAFNTGDDPFDETKPTVKRHLMIDEGLNSLRVKALAFDHDGYVWVGSDAGLNRVTKLSGFNLRVDQMTPLLGSASSDVNCIEVDPFNNKWIGTASGLVRISSDNANIDIYTATNSGLFSDTILGLKYDPLTDVLWVGTDSGLNTFQARGSQTQTTGKTIHAFPNPFSIWGSDSRCTFTNLKLESRLRIYTFDGVLVNDLEVKDTSSEGVSYVIWNGRNFKNEYVGSGVYFFTGEDPKSGSFRDKLAIVRR